MKRALLGVSALALAATLAAGCTDTDTGRVSDRPIDRTPSASPPTTPPPPRATTPSTPNDTTTSDAPSSAGRRAPPGRAP